MAGTGYLCLNILTYSRLSGCQGRPHSSLASHWSSGQIPASDWLTLTNSWRKAEKCQERRFFARVAHWRNWSSEKYHSHSLLGRLYIFGQQIWFFSSPKICISISLLNAPIMSSIVVIVVWYNSGQKVSFYGTKIICKGCCWLVIVWNFVGLSTNQNVVSKKHWHLLTI